MTIRIVFQDNWIIFSVKLKLFFRTIKIIFQNNQIFFKTVKIVFQDS